MATPKIEILLDGGPYDGQRRQVSTEAQFWYGTEKSSLDLEPGDSEVKKIRIHKYKKQTLPEETKQQQNKPNITTDNKSPVFVYQGWEHKKNNSLVNSM